MSNYILGTGISFVFIPSITLLSHYFKKWRAVAFTISFSGIGVGTLIMPLYIKWAIGLFGWRGAYLMTAGQYIVWKQLQVL